MITPPSIPRARRSLKDYIGIVARGFCMGAADIVPGVSGGTMAFILGIYHELIDSIKAADAMFFRLLLRLRIKDAAARLPWRFLLSLISGIALAIVTLAHFLETQLDQHPTRVWAFFFGLVLASVITVGRNVSRWNTSAITATLLAIAGAYLLVGTTSVHSPETVWFLFISGALAIVAMILPGVSGAYVLVLLGKYRFVLAAVNNRDIFTLAVVAAGAALGLATFARLLSWLFSRYHDLTVASLTGLMLGSLRKVWPWKDPVNNADPVLPAMLDSDVVFTIAIGTAGFVSVFLLTWLAARRQQPADAAH